MSHPPPYPPLSFSYKSATSAVVKPNGGARALNATCKIRT